MIHWKVTLTPLVGLVEVGTVDPEDLGRSYDRATGAMVPSPNAELVADRVINLPIQKRADEEVYKFFHGANLFNYQPIMAHTQCSYHLDTVVGATGHPQVILIAAHKRVVYGIRGGPGRLRAGHYVLSDTALDSGLRRWLSPSS
jgi:hypothetical protein